MVSEMECNVGGIDRGIRVIVGIILIGLMILLGLYSQLIGIVIGIIGLLMLVTGASGYCPLYKILGTNTCKTQVATEQK